MRFASKKHSTIHTEVLRLSTYRHPPALELSSTSLGSLSVFVCLTTYF